MQIFTHPQNEPTDKPAYRWTVKHVCSLALHKHVNVCLRAFEQTHRWQWNRIRDHVKSQTEPKGLSMFKVLCATFCFKKGGGGVGALLQQALLTGLTWSVTGLSKQIHKCLIIAWSHCEKYSFTVSIFARGDSCPLCTGRHSGSSALCRLDYRHIGPWNTHCWSSFYTVNIPHSSLAEENTFYTHS